MILAKTIPEIAVLLQCNDEEGCDLGANVVLDGLSASRRPEIRDSEPQTPFFEIQISRK